MAPKITSSSDRSKRKTNKPVRSDKGRSNRQKASTANVTNDGARKKNSGANVTNASQRTSTGSAKVTGGPAKPQASLPPARPRPNAAPTRPSIGKVSGPASNPKPPGTNASLKPNGNFKAPSVPNAKAAVKAPVRTPSKLMRGGAATAVVGALLNAPEEIRKGIRLAKDPKGTIQRASEEYLKGSRTVPKDANGRSSQGIRVSDKGNKRDYLSAPTGSQEYNDYRRNQLQAEKNRLKNVGTRSANDAQSSRSSAQREAVGGRTAAPATRQSVTRPSAPAKSAPKPADKVPSSAAPKNYSDSVKSSSSPASPAKTASSSAGRRGTGRDEMIQGNLQRIKDAKAKRSQPTEEKKKNTFGSSSIYDSTVKLPDTTYKSPTNNTSTAYSSQSASLAEELRKRRGY